MVGGCECRQIAIGEMRWTGQGTEGGQVRRFQRISPKFMSRVAGQPHQDTPGIRDCSGIAKSLVGRETKKTELGDWTGGEFLLGLQPCARKGMVLMIGPCPCNQDVDVQKRSHGVSTSSLFIRSLVIVGASAGTTNIGKPSSAVPSRACRLPRPTFSRM